MWAKFWEIMLVVMNVENKNTMFFLLYENSWVCKPIQGYSFMEFMIWFYLFVLYFYFQVWLNKIIILG